MRWCWLWLERSWIIELGCWAGNSVEGWWLLGWCTVLQHRRECGKSAWCVRASGDASGSTGGGGGDGFVCRNLVVGSWKFQGGTRKRAVRGEV